jgi:hypothetical protein
MQKTQKQRGRVLARVLADDLRRIPGGSEGATTQVTEPDSPSGKKDITNGPTDFDLPPPV